LTESKRPPISRRSEAPGDEPVCIKGYASAENILERVDPVFSEQRYNQVPVRVIIDREGKVKHVHFLSAFPAQSQAITAALSQWRFKPYLRNGQPVEVETGMLFGRVPRGAL
jgi:riboflavin biosynthesis pyrimidine reductase